MITMNIAELPLSFTILVGLIGVSLGSFGTMLLYRLPRDESIMGRSRCTQCGHVLHWYDLIPIVSFLLLRGKCHYCRTSISWRYPLTEALTALVFILMMMKFAQSNLIFIFLLGVAVYSLLLIGLYDFATQKIPDVFVIILLLSGILLQATKGAFGDSIAMRSALLGASIPFVFFGAMWLLSHQKWIGSGDILLGTAIGILLGVQYMVLALFLAYAMGALVALTLITLKRTGRQSRIAFGPFLVSGALLALFAGETLLEQYTHLMLLS